MLFLCIALYLLGAPMAYFHVSDMGMISDLDMTPGWGALAVVFWPLVVFAALLVVAFEVVNAHFSPL